MKNLKIKQKLIVSFGPVLAVTLVLIAATVLALFTSKAQINYYATSTVPGSNDVWQIRRDLVSMQRNMMLALESKDLNEIQTQLDAAAFEGTRVYDTLDKYATYARTDPGLIASIRDGFPAATTAREKIHDLLIKNTEAAKNTTVLIEGSIKAVSGGGGLAQETANQLQDVVRGARETSEVIKQITLASNEQAQAISQITVGLDQISAVVHTNSATAEESAAASEELSGQAQMLRQLLSTFRLVDVVAMRQAQKPSNEKMLLLK